jgi:hypothetical protein
VLRAARLKTNRVFTTKALSAIKMVLKAYCASHLSSPAHLAVFWQFQGCQPVCLLQVCLCGARMSVEPRQPAVFQATPSAGGKPRGGLRSRLAVGPCTISCIWTRRSATHRDSFTVEVQQERQGQCILAPVHLRCSCGLLA